jgi:hypothetical protein
MSSNPVLAKAIESFGNQNLTIHTTAGDFAAKQIALEQDGVLRLVTINGAEIVLAAQSVLAVSKPPVPMF